MTTAQSLAGATRDVQLEATLSRHIGKSWLGRPLYAFQSVGSTMEIAYLLAVQHAPEGTLVWAASQTQGHGRFGREWKSPLGGVYCSILLRPNCSANDLPQLSLIAGLAVTQALVHLTGFAPSIRWPNDVLLTGRKVAGILTELKGDTVLVGIGINVSSLAGELPEQGVSLAMAGAGDCDPFQLTAELCQRFQRWYDEWHRDGFGHIREALRSWMGGFGQPVDITAGSEQFRGTAQDLDEQGRLVVRLDSGVLRPFDAGEVTLLTGKTA